MVTDLSPLQLYLLNRVYWAEKWLKMLKQNPMHYEKCKNLDKDINTKYDWAHLMSPDGRLERSAFRLVDKMIEMRMLHYDESKRKWRRNEEWIRKYVMESPMFRLYTDFSESIPEMLAAPASLFKNGSGEKDRK